MEVASIVNASQLAYVLTRDFPMPLGVGDLPMKPETIVTPSQTSGIKISHGLRPRRILGRLVTLRFGKSGSVSGNCGSSRVQ